MWCRAAVLAAVVALVFVTPAGAAGGRQIDGYTFCPNSRLIERIDVIWRDPLYDSYTNIAVYPSEASRANIVGGGQDLVDEFLACMRRFSISSDASIQAERYEVVKQYPPWWCPSVLCPRETEILVPTVFSPDSTDKADWRTFIDQLQCHDAPPGPVESAALGANKPIGGDTWDLEGHRRPTRNRAEWVLHMCNWGGSGSSSSSS